MAPAILSSDRRRSVVRATPHGLELLAQADAIARSIEDELFGELDPGARDQLAAAMRAALARAQSGD